MSDSFKDFDTDFDWDTLFGEKVEPDDPDRELDAKEITQMWEKVFEAIGTPQYQDILSEASDLFIDLPNEDYIDPQDMLYSYAKAIAYRNKLIRIKIKIRRVYSAKNRSYNSMSRSIIGKQRGTKVEKESKAADMLSKYEKEVGDAKDALDTLVDIIDNLDSTAMQLSRILRLMEIRPNNYYLDKGNAYNQQGQNDEDLGTWGAVSQHFKEMR